VGVVALDLVTDRPELLNAALGVCPGPLDQRTARVRTELPSEEQPKHQAVPWRPWLDRLREQLLQPPAPRRRDREGGRAGSAGGAVVAAAGALMVVLSVRSIHRY
jgi:hypothetical protein